MAWEASGSADGVHQREDAWRTRDDLGNSTHRRDAFVFGRSVARRPGPHPVPGQRTVAAIRAECDDLRQTRIHGQVAVRDLVRHCEVCARVQRDGEAARLKRISQVFEVPANLFRRRFHAM